MNDIAKIFWTGRSQAVRLPKAYRFDDREVTIRREGRRVILEPVTDAAESDLDWAERLAGSMDDEWAKAVMDGRPGPETLPEWADMK